MSRTYRSRSANCLNWELVDYVPDWRSGCEIHYGLYRIKVDPKSQQGKRIIAKTKSDAFKEFKEPGPAWFRNLFTERPQRREAKRQLQKFIQNQDYEVMLCAKNYIPYWT